MNTALNQNTIGNFVYHHIGNANFEINRIFNKDKTLKELIQNSITTQWKDQHS